MAGFNKFTYHTMADGSVWKLDFTNYSWTKMKEKNVAGITKIGQHEVTEIKRDAAQVGCTKVTRAEVEELLKKMDSAPVARNFEIVDAGSYDRFTKFTIHTEDFGSISASEEKDAEYGGPFGFRSASFCLRPERAQALFNFLGGALGHDSYTSEGYITTRFTKV